MGLLSKFTTWSRERKVRKELGKANSVGELEDARKKAEQLRGVLDQAVDPAKRGLVPKTTWAKYNKEHAKILRTGMTLSKSLARNAQMQLRNAHLISSRWHEHIAHLSTVGIKEKEHAFDAAKERVVHEVLDLQRQLDHQKDVLKEIKARRKNRKAHAERGEAAFRKKQEQAIADAERRIAEINKTMRGSDYQKNLKFFQEYGSGATVEGARESIANETEGISLGMEIQIKHVRDLLANYEQASDKAFQNVENEMSTLEQRIQRSIEAFKNAKIGEIGIPFSRDDASVQQLLNLHKIQAEAQIKGLFDNTTALELLSVDANQQERQQIEQLTAISRQLRQLRIRER